MGRSSPHLLLGERGEVHILPDAAALARAAADSFADAAIAAVALRGRAAIALSGGSTPRRMGELLALPPYRGDVPWDRLEIFWGDERWVPEDDPESNAGVAKRTFLDKVPVPSAQIHPFLTMHVRPDQAAQAYAATILSVLGSHAGVPRFDLVLLGMGDDGHTASLFPGTEALRERSALVVAHDVPKLHATRLTLTPPVLNAGRQVVFLVTGADKAQTLSAVLEGPVRPEELPAQLVRPVDGTLRWLVDRDAASRLAALDLSRG